MKNRKFRLTEFAADNIKTVYFFTALVIMAGLMAYRSPPKELLPEVVFPFFSVSTIYPGTSPADMESLVTRPIEKQLKGVNGIKNVFSNFIQDFSIIFIEFETSASQMQAYLDVREAVDKAKHDLPINLLQDPEVSRIEISEFPVVNINLSGDAGLVKLKEYADDLQELIEEVEEITRVDIVGALDREIQINIDLYKMQAAGLSFMQVENAVAMENMTISSGFVRMDGMRHTMRIPGEFKTVDQIRNILLKDGLFLKDIAEVVDGYADRESYARLNESDVITLNVIKKGGANLINAVDKTKEVLAKYQENLPDNVIIQIAGDNSTWTRNSVKDLFNTIILGFLVVVVVLMFFMGVDNALFVASAIPLSMLIAFVIIPLVGFSMNMVVLIFSIFLLGVKTSKIVVFPENNPGSIYVYLRMPSGTDIEVTDSVTRVLEKKVFDIIGHDNPDVESVVSNVAIGAGQNFFERSTQPKLGKVTITFVEYKYRQYPNTLDYVEQLRAGLRGTPGAEIVVDFDEMGPPTGLPIAVEISGDDINELIALSERVQQYIESLNIAGIEELKSDMEVSNPELIINIDREKANKLGVSTAYVGMTLRTALYGKEISKFREGEDEYDIRLRLKDEYRDDLQKLLDMKITVPGGPNGMNEIPISALAEAQFGTSYGGIIRKDHKRMITLGSNVLAGYNANEIVNRLKREIRYFDLPEGYEIAFGGEQDDQNEAAGFLGWAMFVAIGLIFIILVTQFNSISKPIIVLVQVLFSIIGVLLGLVIFQLDVSVIMTGMGVIAVAGIVVKNAIILIDFADLKVKERPDRNLTDVLIEVGATRLTPVLLTAASTILGLLPLAIGINIDFQGLFTALQPDIYFGGDSAMFWKPLAWTIIFGLAFANFLTLVVIPAMYLIVARVKTWITGLRVKNLAPQTF